MIGGGLPVERNDHAEIIIDTALKMLDYMTKRNRKTNLDWKLRIGINSGPVVAGIVGTHKFTYDIWGDAVNIASRMEKYSEPGRINISGTTYDIIRGKYVCDYRGKLHAKGKGEIDMYFVKGKK